MGVNFPTFSTMGGKRLGHSRAGERTKTFSRALHRNNRAQRAAAVLDRYCETITVTRKRASTSAEFSWREPSALRCRRYPAFSRYLIGRVTGSPAVILVQTNETKFVLLCPIWCTDECTWYLANGIVFTWPCDTLARNFAFATTRGNERLGNGSRAYTQWEPDPISPCELIIFQ